VAGEWKAQWRWSPGTLGHDAAEAQAADALMREGRSILLDARWHYAREEGGDGKAGDLVTHIDDALSKIVRARTLLLRHG
jgi:fructose-1,6-bisphosphatase/inositol monophosphatase family enzyme